MRHFPGIFTTFSARAALGLSSLIASCAEAPTSDEGVAPMSDPALPTYEQFKADKFEPKLDSYIVEGDLGLSETELRAYYDRKVAAAEQANAASDETALKVLPLLVGHKNDKDVVWSSQAANALTYCVDKAGFGADYATMVATMHGAAHAWEQHANVDFIHDVAADDNCNTGTGVVFNVRSFFFTNNLIARAFFPDANRAGREVLVHPGIEGDVNVLTHELGHVLGFRHENNRQNLFVRTDAECNGWEDPGWRALTEDDRRDSIMDCDGSPGMTAADIRGVACTYGDVHGNLPPDCGISGLRYRASIDQFGWQGFMVNGDVAGSQGQSRPMQAIQIMHNLPLNMHVCYQVHVSDVGWLEEVCDGLTAGGGGHRLEAIRIRLVNAPPGCSIGYHSHVAHVGWQVPVTDGELSGSVGESRAIEAIRIALTPECF